MSVRKLATLGVTATALVVSAVFAAQLQARSSFATVRLSTGQGEFQPGTLNNGWWNDAGLHQLSHDNYIVGNDTQEGGEGVTRDFFTFDTSAVTGCARSATLQIPWISPGPAPGFPPPFLPGSGDRPGGSPAGGLYMVHDVSTDPFTLNATSGPNTAIFDDLGTGAVYGSRFLQTVGPYAAEAAVVAVNTSAALHDLNRAIRSGGFFSVGGMIAGEPTNTWTFAFTPVFDGNGVNRPVSLLVTVGPCSSGS
jgi:hypothetical protein